jgi:hypothetical protein
MIKKLKKDDNWTLKILFLKEENWFIRTSFNLKSFINTED